MQIIRRGGQAWPPRSACFNGAASVTEAEAGEPSPFAHRGRGLQRGRLVHRGGGGDCTSRSPALGSFNGAASVTEAEGGRAGRARGRPALQRGRLGHRGGGPRRSLPCPRATSGFNGAASVTEAEGGLPPHGTGEKPQASTGPPRSPRRRAVVESLHARRHQASTGPPRSPRRRLWPAMYPFCWNTLQRGRLGHRGGGGS